MSDSGRVIGERYAPEDGRTEIERLRTHLARASEVWQADTLTIRRLRAELLKVEGELARHKDNALTILHNLSPQDGGVRGRSEVSADDPIGKALALIPLFSGELDRLREMENGLVGLVEEVNARLPRGDRVTRDSDVHQPEEPLLQIRILLSFLYKEIDRLREIEGRIATLRNNS